MEIKLSSNPDHHPIMQTDPCVSSNAPSLSASGEPSHPVRFCFLARGRAAWGVHRAWRGISPCVDSIWGNPSMIESQLYVTRPLPIFLFGIKVTVMDTNYTFPLSAYNLVLYINIMTGKKRGVPISILIIHYIPNPHRAQHSYCIRQHVIPRKIHIFR